MRWLEEIPIFTIQFIKREMGTSATTFLRMRLGSFARQKMFERAQQERSELPFVAVGHAQIISREQPREEFLSQVLGIMHIASFPPNVSVERIPVGAAQFLQRLMGLRRL